MTKQRIYYWDNLKGFLIICVIFGHLFECYINDSHLLPKLWVLIYSFHMPLFIFLNGYFTKLSSTPVESKIIKMFFSYLTMQILFTALGYFTTPNFELLYVLASPQYCCWYLLFMAYAYILAKFLVGKEKQLPRFLCIAFMCSLLIGFDESVGHTWAVARTVYFLPYFLTGYLAASKKYNPVEKQSSLRQKIYSIIMIIIIFLFLWYLYSNGILNRFVLSGNKPYERLYPDYKLLGLLFRIMIYILSVLLSLAIMNLMSRKKCLLSYIGQHTLLIYLVHIFVIRAGFIYLKNITFTENKELNSCIILLLLILLVIFVCFFIGNISIYLKRNFSIKNTRP